jgi:hypothetical protein
MYIEGNGNIGIGVAFPTVQLAFTETGNGIGRSASNALSFYTSNIERGRFHASGGLSIATATLQSGTTLTVNGIVRATGYQSSDGSTGVTQTGSYTNFTIKNGLITAAS